MTGVSDEQQMKVASSQAKLVAQEETALQNQAIGVLNSRQAGNDVNSQIDGLNAAIDQNTSLCNTSQQSYQAFVDALSKLQNK